MTWNPEDPEGNEAAKIRFEVVPYTRGTVLDLGCGPWKAFPHFMGVDNCDAVTRFGTQFTPDVQCDAGDPAAFAETFNSLSVDAVFSSHLLEHIEDAQAALAAWWDAIKVGGHLVLYLPHAELYPRMGEPGSNPDHKHDFLPSNIIGHMETVGGWDLLVDETRAEGAEYSFLQVYRKRADGVRTVGVHNQRPEGKTACVVRYGGFGDMLQAANILPELKRQGYHVTVMTTPKGQEILKADPHVDAFFIQDDNQVPNEQLPEFWAAQAKHFDKFVQLSESVEGTLLAMPGRANHQWPHAVRDREMNKNYLEWTAELAELPYLSEAKFYPTDREKQLCSQYLGQVKRKGMEQLPALWATPPAFTVLWALAGSSFHKTYPHQDIVIGQILAGWPDARIILTGDVACKVLEQGWEDHPRVQCASGELGIRETLTLAQMADCVIGPETGVLNAVAFEPMAKVVFLSHSSKRNLSMHWVNTWSLTPANTSCYPCHRLHLSSEHCRIDEDTFTAACQVDIKPGFVMQAVERAYKEWQGLQRALKVRESAGVTA